MSAFCVFGVSKSICKKTAERKIAVTEKITIEQWAKKRDEMAEALFDGDARRVQISPKFDAPQFAEDWINSARHEVRDCVIMVRGEKVDKHGGPIIKGGVPVMTWVEYDANKQPSFGPLA